MLIGFVHGVMNTDNTSISGETIDYGPCAFLDGYDPATVFSSIDRHGRYAYGNQPRVMQWNLARLAEALLPLLGEDEEDSLHAAQEAIAASGPVFKTAYNAGLHRKLGLFTEREGDTALAEDLLARMAANRADFTLTFRQLCHAAPQKEPDGAVRSLFSDSGAYDSWAIGWRRRLSEEPESPDVRAAAMRAVNPAYIARNHLVEAALDAASSQGDFSPFEELLDVLSRPFEEQPGFERYAALPPALQSLYRTFCGT